MRKGLLGGALVIALLSLGGQAMAAEKEYCCWRVDADSAGVTSVDHGSDMQPGASNGTFKVTWNWELRELMTYFQSKFGTGGVHRLEPISKKGTGAVRGRSRFQGMESSNQWTVDSAGTRVDYPPCSYVKDLPWTRDDLGGPQVEIRGDPLGWELDVHEQGADGADVYDGPCNNNPPFYSPFDNYQSYFGNSNQVVSDWDAFGGAIGAIDFEPKFKPGKLKKQKDYEVVFHKLAPLANESGDSRFDHTGTHENRISVHFTYFHRDRLQREIDQLAKLG